MTTSTARRFQDFYVGQGVFFETAFTRDDFALFEKLSGDANPLHSDSDYAKASELGDLVVPVHMVIAPLSRIAGMIFPGTPSLYLSHEVKALKPVFFDENLTYSARIVSVNLSLRVLGIRVHICRGLEVVAVATMKVKSRVHEWVDQQLDDHTRFGGKTFLITGATGEIGTAIALRVASTDMRLILQHRRNDEKLEELKRKLSAGGYDPNNIEYLAADLANATSVGTLHDIISGIGPVDYLVHTASPPIKACLLYTSPSPRDS